MDAEKGLLGSIMLSPQESIEACHGISEAHFYFPAHRTTYTALLDVWDSGKAIDLITFTEELRKRKVLEQVGGAAYVTELFTFVPTAANIQYYIDIIREKHCERETMLLGRAMASGDIEPDQAHAQLSALIVRAHPKEACSRTLDQFSVDPDTNGGNLLGKRWLCRRGGLLLAAPTGIGKTSFVTQASIMWSLGRDHFGIKPFGKLRILIIQAENDDGDMAEIRDGIFAALNLSKQEQDEACAAIKVVCESAATGDDFIRLIRRLVSKHRPDLLLIDPFFAYLGDSVGEQKSVSKFLRNGINPILQEYECGMILVHHTNKPKTGKEKENWQAGDYAYLGSGTNEIANWARAVMAIRSLGSHTVFSVELGKRGRRAGLVNDNGETIYSFFIKHAKHGFICWEPATDADFISQGKGTVKTTDDIYRLLPMKGCISQARLFESAKSAGIGVNLARDLIEELISERPQRAFLWEIKRPGTRPAKSYSRHEQELLK
jgi:hypothetical protein